MKAYWTRSEPMSPNERRMMQLLSFVRWRRRPRARIRNGKMVRVWPSTHRTELARKWNTCIRLMALSRGSPRPKQRKTT